MKRILSILSIALVTISAMAIPQRPSPPRLVNDFANMLTRPEQQALEQKLVEFSRSTSTQMVVVTVNTLNGEAISMAATEIGHEWGVGQADKDNGIVLLIKQKTASEKGEAFIATGYGLEGVIPDAIAKRIIENELLPNFRQGKFYGGITQTMNTLMNLSLGEFSAQEYTEKTAPKKNPSGFIVPILLFLYFFGNIFGRARRMRRNSLGRGLSFWMLLSLMGSGSRSSSGGFGNFSSGGGSFGGFGGGGFGGGGAGGSW